MLNFLGITRHLSTTAGYAKRIGWLLREDVTYAPFPVTGVSFSGTVKTEEGELPISISHGEQENYLELIFPALPIGRWPYAIHAQDESGEDLRLFAGYIGAVDSVAPIEASTVYDIPVMGIAIPIEAGKTIKAQWLSNTASTCAAREAQEDAAGARTDAETASQAATTATGAATTAKERAKEAEGYAGAAYSSKVTAGNSASSASTSAANAARDAKAASDTKTAMESLASSFTETVSNGEQAISAAKNEAISSIQTKQADSVLAVGRASQTAQQNVTNAQSTAIQAVQTAQTAAIENITPFVQQARQDAQDARAAQIDAADAATAAQQALAAIPRVDAGGNMTLAGGLTATGTVNANGGVNIPLVAGASTDTASVNRAYALGLVQAAMMHQTRTYWLTDACTATNGVIINHVVPGCYCEARMGENARTSLTMQTTGVVGASNYSKILGYSLPVRCDGGVPGAWSKVSMIIGAGGEWTEHPDGGMDDFRFHPVAGSSPSISRLIEVTLYYQDGYKARVRELIGVGSPRSYVVRTTDSALNYDHNSNPSGTGYRLVITQSQLSYTDALAAGVWLIMGGASADTVIKLADIRGWDTYHISAAPSLFLDVQASSYGGVVRMETPTLLNGIGNNTYVEYGLTPFQRVLITSETEVPYTNSEQPTA